MANSIGTEGRTELLQAITLDFWGTLYEDVSTTNERLPIIERALAAHGQSRSLNQIEAASKHAWTVWERTWIEEHRSLPISCWLDEVLGTLDVKLPSDTRRSLCRPLQEIYLNEDCAPQPIAGVLEIVPRLAQRYRLGLISDTGLTPGRVLREVMNRDGLLRYFSVETFSDEIGVTKPEPQAFIHTLEALGAPASAAAHIGDLPETDIVGARGVGMRAILFLGKSHREDGRPLADAAFEDYVELENLLMDLP